MGKTYEVASSMIGLPGGGAENRRRGDIVTSEELGDREVRYVELGAIREITAPETTALDSSAPDDTAPSTESSPTFDADLTTGLATTLDEDRPDDLRPDKRRGR